MMQQARALEEQASSLLGQQKTPEQELAANAQTTLKQLEGRTKNDQTRATDYIMSLKASLESQDENSPVKQGIRCFCKYGVKPLIIIVMAYVWVGKQIYKVYKMLPMNLISMVYGVGLCFFGGMYFAAIAAVEAAQFLGGQELMEHITVCWEEANQVAVASAEDDKKDENKDGIVDVEQMSTNDLINHKAKVALVAVKDPMRLQQAIFKLMNVWLAVIATLKLQFARTVAISLGIADMLIVPTARVAGPPLCMLMGPDLNHWVPVIIDTTLKIIAVIVATYVQSILSAFYSGLKGGKVFATGLINIATEKGLMEKVPDFVATKPFDPDKSLLDEFLAYPLAAVGFYWQITNGFALDFPANLILLPLTIVEYAIRWQVYT